MQTGIGCQPKQNESMQQAADKKAKAILIAEAIKSCPLRGFGEIREMHIWKVIGSGTELKKTIAEPEK